MSLSIINIILAERFFKEERESLLKLIEFGAQH